MGEGELRFYPSGVHSPRDQTGRGVGGPLWLAGIWKQNQERKNSGGLVKGTLPSSRIYGTDASGCAEPLLGSRLRAGGGGHKSQQ